MGPARDSAVVRAGRRSTPTVVMICALAATAGAGQPHSSSTLAVTVTSRSLAPGEVVRMDIRPARPVSSVRVKAFDRDVAAAPVGATLWRALVGIDLDTSPGDYPVAIEARTSDDALLVATDSLRVEPKEFPIRMLRVEPRFVTPPRRVQARLAREAGRLRDLFALETPQPLWYGPFQLPIPGAVVSGFGVRSVFNGEPRAPHGGADFRGPTGTAVKLPNSGRVVLVGRLYFTGMTVVVDHGMGLLSLFAHLSRVNVRNGEMVRRGGVIGAVGATGRATGPHLHWTVRLHQSRVDPISLIHVLADPQQPRSSADAQP
jgi:murein DD-endopeptidase MepM/ murein hydrolase activator NlpD